MFTTIVFMIIAYLLGSVNSAVLICQWKKLPDPRTQGSKNPGATNVLRYADKQTAGLVLAADLLKGMIAVLFARLFGFNDFGLGMIALAVTIGHIYPVFFGFKGGKGVATAIGG